MDFTITEQPKGVKIALKGQFSFTENAAFKKILDYIEQHNPQAVVLNFADVDFIDSAGLGMLLLMRDACQQKSISLSFQAVHGQVKKIFGISKFDQLFSMSA